MSSDHLTGDFVNKVASEADEAFRPQFSKRERVEKIERYTKALCREKGVNIAELRSGSRRPAAVGDGSGAEIRHTAG